MGFGEVAKYNSKEHKREHRGGSKALKGRKWKSIAFKERKRIMRQRCRRGQENQQRVICDLGQDGLSFICFSFFIYEDGG